MDVIYLFFWLYFRQVRKRCNTAGDKEKRGITYYNLHITLGNISGKYRNEEVTLRTRSRLAGGSLDPFFLNFLFPSPSPYY